MNSPRVSTVQWRRQFNGAAPGWCVSDNIKITHQRKTIMSNSPILAHRNPLRRHSKHVELARWEAIVRLPGDDNLPSPGLHLVLTFEDGATQRVIFPEGKQLNDLHDYTKMAIAAWAAPAVAPLHGLSKEQTEAIASSIRSLRYGAHPHRSPHADDLVKLFPDIKL